MADRNEFWDRGGAANGSDLDPSKYHNPADETLPLSKRSLASALPPAFGGATGVIVPRATEGGAPLGFRQGAVAARVNVDPDIPGEGFVIDMASITKEAGAAETHAAGVRDAVSIEDRRFRASQAFHAFAISNKPDRPADGVAPPRESPIPLPGVYVVPEAAEGGGQKPMPEPTAAQPPQSIATVPVKQPAIPGFDNTGPAPAGNMHSRHGSTAPVPASFTKMAAKHEAPPPAQVPAQAPAQTPSLFAQASNVPTPAPVAHNAGWAPGAPPTYRVTFEVEGAPMIIEGWYHQIIVAEHVLALCYDTSVTGFPRTTLRPTEVDIAIHIHGSEVFYIAQDPNVKFTHNGEEIQLFFIKAEHPFNVEQPDSNAGGIQQLAQTM